MTATGTIGPVASGSAVGDRWPRFQHSSDGAAAVSAERAGDATAAWSAVVEHLDRGGSLARSLSGFSPRPQQLGMARAVARTLTAGRTLVCEAGTGPVNLCLSGPALLCGRRVIISTATRNLQEQLFHRDLPLVAACPRRTRPGRPAQGAAELPLPHRLEALDPTFPPAGGGSRSGGPPAVLGSLTRSGDLAELADLPEDSPLWREVTSSADNCLGRTARRLPSVPWCAPARQPWGRGRGRQPPPAPLRHGPSPRRPRRGPATRGRGDCRRGPQLPDLASQFFARRSGAASSPSSRATPVGPTPRRPATCPAWWPWRTSWR